MKKSISIIIAIFNRKDELSDLLFSLTKQTDSDFEVIVVDDGSKIDLSLVIEVFSKKLDLKYFKKMNSGAGLSRNFGVEKASGEWVIFLDSDVIVEQDYIQNVRNNLAKNPADAFGGADKADKNFNVLQKAISYSMTSVLTTGGIRGSKKSVGKFQPRSFNMGVKKTAFEQVGGFSEMRIGEDPDLSMTLWENGFQTRFYDDIAVYHKRRTDLIKFAKQVFQFGVARPILNQRHPQYVKPTFWFPSLVLLGLIFSVFCEVFLNFGLFLQVFCVYIVMIFLHSSWIYKNLNIGVLSVLSTLVQMFSYGWGFLLSWAKLNIQKKAPQEAFPKHFYHQ